MGGTFGSLVILGVILYLYWRSEQKAGDPVEREAGQYRTFLRMREESEKGLSASWSLSDCHLYGELRNRYRSVDETQPKA